MITIRHALARERAFGAKPHFEGLDLTSAHPKEAELSLSAAREPAARAAKSESLPPDGDSGRTLFTIDGRVAASVDSSARWPLKSSGAPDRRSKPRRPLRARRAPYMSLRDRLAIEGTASHLN